MSSNTLFQGTKSPLRLKKKNATPTKGKHGKNAGMQSPISVHYD